MADVKISALLDLGTAPAANDYVPIVDASAAATKRVTVADLFTSPDVTGTLTADGLSINGANQLQISNGFSSVVTGSPSAFIYRSNGGGSAPVDVFGNLVLQSRSDALAAVDFVTGITPAHRMRVGGNGDISFYEDTGTTAKLFWDASTERLGLGTTAPSTDIHVINSSSDAILRLAGQTGARIQLGEADVVDKDWHIVANNGNFIINETTDAGSFVATPFTIEGGAGNGALYLKSGGNLGIGTTSPSAVGTATTTHINGSGGGAIRLSDDVGNAYFDYRDTEGVRISVNSAEPLRFQTSSAERARIDALGNLLVGKTTTGVASAGFQARATGQVIATVDGDSAGILNRATSDGSLLEFRKDNATVGSIGTVSGDIALGSGDTALRFNSGGDAVLPATTTGPASRDNAVSLGNSLARFKDLYLSGGVYLGGVGADNLLSEFEVGTFVATLTDGTNTASITDCKYVKVGKQVTIFMTKYNQNTTGWSGDLIITGMPFASENRDQGGVLYVRTGQTAGTATSFRIANSTTTVELHLNEGSATSATKLQASTAFSMFSEFSYRAAA